MKTLSVGNDETWEVIDIPEPEIDDTSVLCKVLACGICGTDRKVMHGTFKTFDNYPILMGHEAIGEVVKVGKRVQNFKIGDHIICPYLDNVPEGLYTGLGGFSEYTVAHDWDAIVNLGEADGKPDFYQIQKKIPVDIDPVDGVMMITLREVLAACKHFSFRKNDSIVVFGAGSVGLSFLRMLKLLNVGPVISVDVMDNKRDGALEAGADYFINSKKTDVVEEVRRIFPEGTDYVLDAVGFNEVINIGLKLIKTDGKIVVYGVSPVNHMHLDWLEAPFNWKLQFFQFPNKEEEAGATDQIVKWVQEGTLDPREFVSHVYGFNHIDEALKLFLSGKPASKIVITFPGEKS